MYESRIAIEALSTTKAFEILCEFFGDWRISCNNERDYTCKVYGVVPLLIANVQYNLFPHTPAQLYDILGVLVPRTQDTVICTV